MDDLFQDVEGVLVSLFSDFVGLDVEVSSSVNVFFSGIEVSEFLDEVANGDFQRGDFRVKERDVIVNNL